MDIKKLQTLVVDALEDVKAQEIRVFDTTHLTSLFDRVAIASGTSNRQTKALAASVRDKVKSKGGNVVSVEGEDTGEWVLVDLGDMIVHIMQPAIRTYYRLEEIWGDKEVKMGAAKRTTTSAVAKRDAADAPAPKIRRTRAQAEAVEASQALDDDEVKKPARKPRTTAAAGAGATTRTTRAAGTGTRTSRSAAGQAETGAKAATPRAPRAAAGTTRTTTGTKTGTTRTTTGTKTGAAKTTTTRSKTAAPKTAVGKTVRVAPSKSASAKKPASKRVSKA
ncbi:ribosome silencing factor [Herbaspirillum sp. YR522]|uniref:ribosome silencing factor n=1 Tax=Herbaspirillum sp. YR522 TaxID=1144342 RepID=UPI00026F6546|nr:ribosome silencing factor [Herbaspirillum sp. YR522]EJN01774.1 iojap-like ribosome-associated protein [Herbaspirillum sp. YR522]